MATARKLAIIIYKMVTNHDAFNLKAMENYLEKYKRKKINQLKKRLELLEEA